MFDAPLAAAIPAKVVVFTVTAVPYLIAATTLLAVDAGLVRFVPEILVTMFVVGEVTVVVGLVVDVVIGVIFVVVDAAENAVLAA